SLSLHHALELSHTHTRIHTHIHTHTHTHTHTYSYSQPLRDQYSMSILKYTSYIYTHTPPTHTHTCTLNHSREISMHLHSIDLPFCNKKKYMEVDRKKKDLKMVL